MGDESHRCCRQRSTAPFLMLFFTPLMHVSREPGTHTMPSPTERERNEERVAGRGREGRRE